MWLCFEHKKFTLRSYCRKLCKSADTLFCGAFWKYLQKHVLDVTWDTSVPLHPQQLNFILRYTSTSMIPVIAKTYMVAVCYVDGSMRQNYERRNATFPDRVSDECCGCNGFRLNVTKGGHRVISTTFCFIHQKLWKSVFFRSGFCCIELTTESI